MFSCNCRVTEHGPWGCQLWKAKVLPFSNSSVCNFVELESESTCETHQKLWNEASNLFLKCCREETNPTVPNIQMIKATWIGNGRASEIVANYSNTINGQNVNETSKKILFHAAKTIEDTINICKIGFALPQPHECTAERCGNHILGKGIYAGEPKYVANLADKGGIAQGQRDPVEGLLTRTNPLKMLMCEVVSGRSQLVTERIDGQGLSPGFNSHISVGSPPHETVVFRSEAIRPMYLIDVIKV